MQLKNKIALVTGGSRGIGKAIALQLAKQGAGVAIIYAGNTDAAHDTVQELHALGVPANSYRCDVSDFEATKAMTKKVIEDFGGVDILVNNAGITRDGLIHSMKEADFDEVLAINLKGAFNTTKHLFGHLMRRKNARIINITSVVGLSGNKGQANYAAAKAGLIGFTKSTAKELASRGVTCNAIAPGFIESDMTGEMPQKARDALLGGIPAGRGGMPHEVAALVAFLAGENAGYITGQTIAIDGGLSM